ncbi:MAG: hypothetical protein ACRDV6_09705 [Acidimicrobiales bacterium]
MTNEQCGADTLTRLIAAFGSWSEIDDLGSTRCADVYLTDRSVNLIISNGVNIYPAEVDAVLMTLEAVVDAWALPP